MLQLTPCHHGNMYTSIGYFDWMSNDDKRLTKDRLKTIICHATREQDEVLLIHNTV